MFYFQPFIAAIAYPQLRMVAYSAAKAGLHQLSRSVAMQYAARGIRANCLVLGHVETDEIKRRMQARGGANAVAEMVARSGCDDISAAIVSAE